jgi:hypothetical protein
MDDRQAASDLVRRDSFSSNYTRVWSKKSCGFPVVVLQEAAPLLAAHFAIAGTYPLFSCWKEQNIFFTLMVSFSMVVLGECRYCFPQ